MKKLLLLPVLLVTLFSCSTDDSVSYQDESNAVNAASAERIEKPLNPCIADFSGYTIINVEGGFGNPVVEFYTFSTDGRKKKLSSYVEIETLSDCEDVNSGTGMVTSFSGGIINLIPNNNIVTLNPSQLPSGCYRWRLVLTNAPGALSSCTSVTPWYEAPLF